ncbi:hypothetical protein K435DRAFT_796686 [Dendrothele bispora CBS 962.96]|uniref:Uncharacterized protein n=1 Tax=Dendrothele bispora (strain CBS 962.96) TaxID=1314807 RepID=A0A4S8M5K7_DENBC|nr:hypothetical protein K435DRAFT_796686 [Dendrothele bispora CBS 962.96]
MSVDVQETERLQSLADTTASTSNIELGMMSWDSCQDESSSDFESLPDIPETNESDLDSIPNLQEVSDSEMSDTELDESELDYSSSFNPYANDSNYSYTTEEQLDNDTDPEMPDLRSVSDSDANSSYDDANNDTYPEGSEGHLPFSDQQEVEEEFSDIASSPSDALTEAKPKRVIRQPMEVIPDHYETIRDPIGRRMDILLNRNAPYPGDDLDTILRPIFGGLRFYCHRADDPDYYIINDFLYQIIGDPPEGVPIERKLVKNPNFDLVNWYRHWLMRHNGIPRPKKRERWQIRWSRMKDILRRGFARVLNKLADYVPNALEQHLVNFSKLFRVLSSNSKDNEP